MKVLIGTNNKGKYALTKQGYEAINIIGKMGE